MAKKAFAVILALILLCIGLAACFGSKTTIKISASPSKYSPVMSSVQGIRVRFEEQNKMQKLFKQDEMIHLSKLFFEHSSEVKSRSFSLNQDSYSSAYVS